MREVLAGAWSRSRVRTAVIAAMVLAGSGVLAQAAGATLLVQNHTDPAGAPEPFSYHLDLPTGLPPVDFQLRDGEDRAFGPFQGQAVVTEHPPAGWHVADIRCVGQTPADFAPDIPNGRVTVQHHIEAEQICAFTNRPGDPAPPPPGAPAPPTSAAPAPGLAPAPPTSAVPLVTPRRRAAVVRVIPRRRAATARIDIVRRSVIKTQLLWHGRVVGTSRVVRPKGTYDVTVRMQPSVARMLQRQGRKRVTVAVRMVVVPRPGATMVFRYGVIVPL